MEGRTRCILIALFLMVWLSGCAGTAYRYSVPSYTQPLEQGSVLRQISLDPSLEKKILALNSERVTDRDVREVLSRAPAPRIVNIHGGIYRSIWPWSPFQTS